MPDVYQDTISRLEPEIAMTDRDAYGTSAAISLKRLADAITPVAALMATMLTAVAPLVQTLAEQAKNELADGGDDD